jgi:hypothetical protein
MSDRSTIVFGNGLGMALDPEYFQLKSALYNVWNDPDLLSDDQKKLIQTVLPGTSDEVSSDFKRCTSETFIPPNFAFQP